MATHSKDIDRLLVFRGEQDERRVQLVIEDVQEEREQVEEPGRGE